MVSFEEAVQAIILGLLKDSTDLMEAVTGVFDNVPQDTGYPYVVIGEDNHTEWDTETTEGRDVSCGISVWTQGRGKKETKQLQGYIYDALHQVDVTIAGFKVDMINCESSSSFMDADGLTRQGIQEFRVLIERT